MLSLILPAYNEVEALETATREIVAGTRALGVGFELLIIENGSTDGTAALAARLADEIPEVVAASLDRADYGIALRHGLLEATGDVAAIFNVDYYNVEFLRDGLARLGDATSGPAMVLASKRGEDSHDRRPIARRASTALFSALLRVVVHTQVRDTHGMKVLRRDRTDEIVRACVMGADLFDTELVLRCERAGLPIVELPITVDETRPPRSSLVRRVPRTLRGLVRLRAELRTAPTAAGATSRADDSPAARD